MAKGDFDLEPYNENNNMETNETKEEESNNLNNNEYDNNFSDNADLSNVGVKENNSILNDANVVFDGKENNNKISQIKERLSTINKRVVLLFAIALAIVLAIILTIVIIISNYNSSYKATITTPEVIYMGESSIVYVKAEGKKDVSDAVTTFKLTTIPKQSEEEELRNPLVIGKAALEKESITGSESVNAIIPVSEGKIRLEVTSKYKTRTLTHEYKDIAICREFNEKLINGSKFSLSEGTTQSINIDFGIKECSKGITYESMNQNIMTVSKKGEITGVKQGKAYLKVKKGSRSFIIPVYVTSSYISMESIKSSTNKMQMFVGDSARLWVNIFPDNASNQEIEYLSSEESVAKVNNNGFVTALKEGSAVISIKNGNRTAEDNVNVIVSNLEEKEGAIATKIVLDEQTINIKQGSTKKIWPIVLPDNAKDKNLTYTSDYENVAIVKEGVLYAKNAGSTNIHVTTSSNIIKNIKVNVIGMTVPKISASDGISSNAWHYRPYTLRFSGGESGVDYYCGTSENNINTKANELKIDKDNTNTYYVKACKNFMCSSVQKYVSKTDLSKPEVLKVIPVETKKVKKLTVQIALRDNTSLITKYCVTQSNNKNTCKWKSIKPKANPVIPYQIKRNGTYYVFAYNGAGTINNGYKFIVNNII